MQKTKTKTKNSWVIQKRAIIVIAAIVVVLIAALVVANILSDIYTFVDEDGQSYTIKKHDGEYALFKDGDLCDTGTDQNVHYFLTASGTQVQIDSKTGEYKVYAVVDTEDTEQVSHVGNAARVLMFKQLTYDSSSTKDNSRIIKSIDVQNQFGSYTLRRGTNDTFYVEGHSTATLLQQTFAQLSSGCGYTIALQRLEEPRRLPDGSIDYAEYGLASEIREKEGTDGNSVTYDYTPTQYTITTMNEDTYTVTLGDAIVSGNGYYARYADRNTVYILSSTNLDAGVLQPVEALISPMLVYPMTATTYTNVTDFTYRSDFDHAMITRELYASVLGEDVLDALPDTGSELTEEDMALLAQIEKDYSDAVDAMSDEEFSDIYETVIAKYSKLVTKFSYSNIKDRDGTLLASTPYIMDSDYMAGYFPHADNISTMLGLLYSMSFDGVTVLSPTSEDLAAYGLDDYAHTISFIYTDSLGNQIPNYFFVSEKTEDGLYYAYSAMYDMIVCFSKSQAEYLEWEEIDWYEREYFQIYLAFVKSITVEYAGLADPIVFTVDNSKSDQSDGINVENLEVFVDGVAPDYNIFYTTATGDIEMKPPTFNFTRLFRSFLTASIEGNADLTLAEKEAFLHSPDSDCLLKFTVIAEDEDGNSLYNVYRFYRYTERKAYLTIEALDSPTSPSDPSRADGRFYVLRSFCDKLIADVNRFINGEEIIVESKS